jgi:hypothetical protein
MDADFSHDPKFLPDFLGAILENDLVIGSRYKSGVNVVNWPMPRLLLSYFCQHGSARFVTGIPVQDCTAGYKCFRRSVLEALDFEGIALVRVLLPNRGEFLRLAEGLPYRRDSHRIYGSKAGGIEDVLKNYSGGFPARHLEAFFLPHF